MEKAIKALLAIKELNADTHNGCLSQFNIHYIRKGEGEFCKEDYKKIASVERIRNISDYDDFYIADKEECITVVRMTSEFYQKTIEYLSQFSIFEKYMSQLKQYIPKDNQETL